ncbi:MAG: ABC-F family ATP-binding cassette domain-containing protein [Ktedonobacterales bacterium]|nr:ABC-F family ATP-binding cassette domain-containing protein [Ktedonobacterales bacterium]
MLEAQHVDLRRGATLLLEDASFRVNGSEKVGIVGINGAGKTTLLKTLYGELDPDGGTIARPETIGYLGQEPLADALLAAVDGTPLSVLDFMLGGRGLDAMARELREIEAALDAATKPGNEATDSSALLERYGELEAQFQGAGGYDAEFEIVQLLAGLNLKGVEMDRPVSALSGGQKTKLALARVLFSAPEMLFLDEPTNHLDGKATRWLMEYLGRCESAVVLISHDLALLDTAITRILHLDATTKKLTAYKGNYTSYLKQREGAEERAVAQMERTQDKIAQLQQQANWMRGKTEKVARRAKVLDHKVEMLREAMPDTAHMPHKERAFTMDLPITRPSGRDVFRAERVAKSYGTKAVLDSISFEIERQQRLVVIGVNGAGKTTLLKMIAGVLEPTDGAIHRGYNVDVGYFAQEHEQLHPDMTLLEELQQAAEETPNRTGQLPTEHTLRGLLGRFLFSGDQAYQRVGTLSGGEKTRLALARLMLGGYNTLLLDEPTNNLDVASRARVLKALAGYAGTLVIVSHDVAFVEALQPDYALLLPAGQIRYFDNSLLELVPKVK